MMDLKRVMATLSVFGIGLVGVACASPTDAEIAQPAADEGSAGAQTSSLKAGEEAADKAGEEAADKAGEEAADKAGEEAADKAGEEATDEAGEAAGQDTTVVRDHRGYHRHRKFCDYRHAWHCRRGHRGWHWARGGYYAGGWHGGGWHRRERCCVPWRGGHHHW